MRKLYPRCSGLRCQRTGHRARAFRGRAVYRPAAPSRSRVEVVVRADSLEVLTPHDTAEIRKVTEVMRGQVLQAGRHPEIRFMSHDVTRGRDIVGRWCTLAEARLDHLTELFETAFSTIETRLSIG